MAWLTRGEYTYAHRNHQYPIGVDLNLRVYGPPIGVFLDASSVGSRSTYEIVNFQVRMTGQHIIRITRTANRDTTNDVAIGMVIREHD